MAIVERPSFRDPSLARRVGMLVVSRLTASTRLGDTEWKASQLLESRGPICSRNNHGRRGETRGNNQSQIFLGVSRLFGRGKADTGFLPYCWSRVSFFPFLAQSSRSAWFPARLLHYYGGWFWNYLPAPSFFSVNPSPRVGRLEEGTEAHHERCDY